MDDLDRELFSSALKKIKTSSPKAPKGFDEDDPLGDLLSSSGEHTPVKTFSKNSTHSDADISRKHSKNISDLFGLNEKDEDLQSTSSINMKSIKNDDPGDWLGLKADPEQDPEDSTITKGEKYAPSTFQSQHHLSKIKTLDKENLFPAFDLKDNSRTNSSSKKYTMALARNMPAKRSDISLERKDVDMPQEVKKTSSILNSFISDFDSTPTPQVQSLIMKGSDSNKVIEDGKSTSYTPSANRESRRSTRRRGSNVADPLGLFSSLDTIQMESRPQENLRKKKEEPVLKPEDQIPPWLGGLSNLQTPSLPSTQIIGASNDENVTSAESKQDVSSEIDVMAGLANLEMQAGEAATQQQKHLLTALALKRQEDALLKLQAQQASLLAQHEQQLGALVQRQIQRQQQMIRQQEQIQSHIQALMVQPTSVPPLTLPSALWNIEDIMKPIPDSQEMSKSSLDDRDSSKISELKGLIHRLEVEKEDLKIQLESERQRHESHLADMEVMFRRQATIQEEAMIKQEKRFNAELNAMEKEVTSRVNRLKEEHNEESQQQTQRMAQLHGEWLADLQRLGEFHQQAVEVLRSEQTSAIDHWKSLQASEVSAIQEASSNARLLQSAVGHLKETTSSILELKDHIKQESHSQFSQKQESLLKQEIQLASLREALEKQTAALDAEKSCLISMNKELQSCLIRLQQEASEEKIRFQAREKAWEKEKLGTIELLDKEKRLLEKMQSEARSEMAELNEKKLALAADIARLETTLHIQSTNANKNSLQAEQMVAEARATLEAAQEAGKQVHLEQDEVMAIKLSLSAEQKRLGNYERELRIREQHLEDETLKAKAFREEAKSALEEARRLERERSEHASDLAQRLFHLKEREDRLAEEKLAVTIQWKRIQESRENASCSCCGQLPSVNLSSFNKSKDIVDPLPIIMKLEAEQGLDFISLDHPQYNSSLLESISQ